MELAIRKLDIKKVNPTIVQNPRIRNFLENMLAVEDPTRAMQINVGLRRFGSKDGRIIRPVFVPFEHARAMLKGDKNAVVALGNGGYSPVAEPNEWFAGSVMGKVNGTIPFVFNSPDVDKNKQLVYAAPALVIGRGDNKIEMFETEITGEATLGDIRKALSERLGTSRNYGLLELKSKGNISSTYTATYSYSYTTSYATGKCDAHKRMFEVQGEPLTAILSANKQDTHGIRENGENVHVEGIKIPEGNIAKGLVFALS